MVLLKEAVMYAMPLCTLLRAFFALALGFAAAVVVASFSVAMSCPFSC
jgi:hypothetical protein